MVESDNASTMEEVVEELELRRRTPTREEAAQITTAPPNPLVPRQDQSQIDQLNSRIQSLQQSAQQALQSLSDASRQVSQASQQLSQSSQQLSQQSLSLSQKVQQQSQELQQATASINSLNGALSSALSSGSSALASATSSAAAALASALASASGDAATRVGDALAQATLARDQANREVLQAQGTAVSITQAAAAIVGTFIGSSLLTVLLVFIILRYRRRRRRDADGDEGYARPGTRGSYNSMADDAAGGRDVKVRRRPSSATAASPDSGTTKVGGPLSRTDTAPSPRRGDAWELLSQPTADLPPPPRGDPLPKLGVVRKPTITYATAGREADRRPLKLAEPPPAKKKGGGAAGGTVGGGRDNGTNNNNNNDDNDNEKGGSGGGSGGASTGGTTWSVFPKVDPDPKGVLAAAAQREVRPGSAQQAASLQKWLQTAVTVSPFGPLDSRTGPGRPGGGAPPPMPPMPQQRQQQQQPPSRMSEVKWPLQEGQEAKDVGLAYAETPTVATAAVARSVSVKGMKGMGLPGKPRKIS